MAEFIISDDLSGKVLARSFQYMPFEREPYKTIYQLQKKLVEKRIRHEIPNTLLMGEHPHVITLGRGSNIKELPGVGKDVPLFEIERGGAVTYHGPGQLIGYPIFLLEQEERNLHLYLRNLEEVLIRVLAYFDIKGERKPGWTGVWVKDRKIASIGVAVKKWVTYHGFALNVTTDLSFFNRINPCGLPGSSMISIKELLPPDEPESISEALHALVIQEIESVFVRTLMP